MVDFKPDLMLSNILTAYAVQSSVQHIQAEFKKRFTPLPGVPIMFYDWVQGFSEQIKQGIAKVPQQDRNFPWFAILYSYGASKPNPYQPRPIPDKYRLLGYTDENEPIATHIDTRFSQINVVCDVITNDSNYADAIAMHRMLRQSFWQSFVYQDILYPTWRPTMNAHKDMFMLPTVPNGCFYQCVQSGITGKTLPKWPTVLGSQVRDGSVIWESVTPKYAKASIGDFTLPEINTANVYGEGIRFAVRFGYGLNYVALEDTNEIAKGLITLNNYIVSKWDYPDQYIPLEQEETDQDKAEIAEVPTNPKGYEIIP